MEKEIVQLIKDFFRFSMPELKRTISVYRDEKWKGHYSVNFNGAIKNVGVSLNNQIPKSKLIRNMNGVLLRDTPSLSYVINQGLMKFNPRKHIMKNSKVKDIHKLLTLFNALIGYGKVNTRSLELFIPNNTNFVLFKKSKVYYSAQIDLSWCIIRINIIPDFNDVIIEDINKNAPMSIVFITGAEEHVIIEALYDMLYQELKTNSSINSGDFKDVGKDDFLMLLNLKEMEMI